MPAVYIRDRVIIVMLVAAGQTGSTWAENLFPGATFPIGPSPTDSAVGDMNGDGLADLVTSDELAGGPSGGGLGGIIVLINRGDGSFEPPRTTIEVRSRPIVLADI